MFEFLKTIFTKKTKVQQYKPKVGSWTLMGKTYTPPKPPQVVQHFKELPPEQVERLLCGFTTLVWQEEKTGETKTLITLGTDEDKLEALVQRVEMEGMQYFQKDGSTYAIAKWVPQE